MKRRSFLAALLAAPILPTVAAFPPEADEKQSVPFAPANSGDSALNIADVGKVESGILRSRDQRFVVDLDAGTIVIV